jgi:hypothetical protein
MAAVSSDPQEISPGLWVGTYGGPARADGGRRVRWQIRAEDDLISLSYEQMCALRTWFQADVTVPR